METNECFENYGCVCYYCGARMIWDSDSNYDEVHGEGKGVVTFLHCENPKCGATAEWTLKEEDE